MVPALPAVGALQGTPSNRDCDQTLQGCVYVLYLFWKLQWLQQGKLRILEDFSGLGFNLAWQLLFVTSWDQPLIHFIVTKESLVTIKSLLSPKQQTPKVTEKLQFCQI